MKSIFKFVLAPAVLAAAALAATPATAESTVKVPFSFTAGGKICPAGYYTVERESSNFVRLVRRGSSDNFVYLLGPGAPDPNDTKVALTFDKVGNQHVLQSVQYGASVTSRLDRKSLHDAEREATLTGGR